MDKIYRAYINVNTGDWGVFSERNLKYWHNPENARNAIADEFIDMFSHYKNTDELDFKYLFLNSNYIPIPPEGYNFNKLIEDIRSGVCNSVTINGTDYGFHVKEIKTED